MEGLYLFQEMLRFHKNSEALHHIVQDFVLTNTEPSITTSAEAWKNKLDWTPVSDITQLSVSLHFWFAWLFFKSCLQRGFITHCVCT